MKTYPNKYSHILFIAILCFATFFVFDLNAQSLKIKGRVVDISEKALKGAMISVDNSDFVTSDANGLFVMEIKNDNPTYVEVIKEGYKLVKWNFSKPLKRIDIFLDVNSKSESKILKLQGQVLKNGTTPVAKAEVYLLSFPNIKSTTSESGYFTLELPANTKISTQSQFKVNKSTFSGPEHVSVTNGGEFVFLEIANNTKTETTTQVTKESTTSKTTEVSNIVKVGVADATGKNMPNVKVTIDGVVYTTDSKGLLEVPKNLVEKRDEWHIEGMKIVEVTTTSGKNVIQFEQHVIEEPDSSVNLNDSFDKVMGDLEVEKQMLSQQSVKLQQQIESIAEKLSVKGTTLTDAERSTLQQQILRLQRQLEQNQESFLEAQNRTKDIIKRISSEINAKDSINIAQSEQVKQLEEEQRLKDEQFKKNLFIFGGIILVLLGASIGTAYVAKRIRDQRNRLKEVNDALAKAKSDLEDKVEEINQQKEQIQKQAEHLMSANDEIMLQKELIEQKNSSITASINYASRIQAAMLPGLDKMFFKNSFVLYLPRDIVSGDFYWMAEKNGKKVIIAADCTGHGVPGAFMTIIGHDLLNEIILHEGILEPDAILRELDARLLNTLRSQDGVRVNDGMDMAVLIYDEKSNTLEFSGAKNPLCMIRGEQVVKIRGSKFPIGSTQFKIEKVFEKESFQVEKGDKIYIYTDGYQDQFGGTQDQKYLSSRFRKLLQEHAHESMNQQRKILESEFRSWKGNRKQTDDILVIGFEIV